MTEYQSLLAKVNLFQGIPAEELAALLNSMQARTAGYKKGETVLAAGSRPEYIGIVLAGRLHVVKEDVDGNRTLLSALHQTDIFAEALCCAGVEESPVSVLADTDAQVLLLPFGRVLKDCPTGCEVRQRLVGNMLRVVALKSLYLQGRMELIRIRSVRAKVLGYLHSFAPGHGCSFVVPLSREGMADYLCVERSALSHELMRMKREGLIDYSKNRFTLL